jgi:hypothetical protein
VLRTASFWFMWVVRNDYPTLRGSEENVILSGPRSVTKKKKKKQERKIQTLSNH